MLASDSIIHPLNARDDFQALSRMDLIRKMTNEFLLKEIRQCYTLAKPNTNLPIRPFVLVAPGTNRRAPVVPLSVAAIG